MSSYKRLIGAAQTLILIGAYLSGSITTDMFYVCLFLAFISAAILEAADK